MNRAILMGRLTQDPTIYTSSRDDGSTLAIVRYTLAIDRRRRGDNGESQADFLRCIVFGKGAEFAYRYFKKGQRVLVEGRIQTGSYRNRDDQLVYTTDIIVENQEFADSKNNSQSENSNQSRDIGQSARDAGFEYEDRDMSFMDIPDGIDDEGLPFNF